MNQTKYESILKTIHRNKYLHGNKILPTQSNKHID